VLKGFLQPISADKINYVNAKLIIDSMGVEFVESKSSQLDKYTNLITVRFFSKNGSVSVSGTVFARHEIRIVDFFGYKLDFEPTSNVLAIQNVDKPGIIGKIGTVLGEENINISAMQWGTRGDKAVSFVSVDNLISKDTISKLKGIDGVLKVSSLRF
jgi:D-3-phosphoglycerate dehydrogenase